MKAVSRFENRLLRILQCFLRHLPVAQVQPEIETRFEEGPPTCLSRAAVDLVQDTLAKGCTAILAGAVAWRREGSMRGDGWRRERFLRDERVAEGRLWERTPPRQLGLTFSRHTLDFLMWITALKPAEAKTAWEPPEQELTVGDLFLLFLAFEALRSTYTGGVLRARRPFTRHGLCRLAFSEDFQDNPEDPAPHFAPWTTGVGACILESLQRALAERWVEVERHKAEIADWQQMRGLGRAQELALHGFLDAVAAVERPDLARFLLMAAAEAFDEGITADRLVGGLRNAGPRMADRMETNQGALALARQLDRLRKWEREARRVGYFDEGYARSQLWLLDWERWQGDAVHGRAQSLIRQLDPMKQGAATGGPAPRAQH
jgi:FtsH ternary system domain X6